MSAAGFWARRKAAVEAEAQAEAQAADAAEAQAVEAGFEGKADAEVLEELGLPDPDTLGLGDDFKVFLSKAVPARIRTRALRRLWGVNPVLANLDGLLDYGEDFTEAAMAVENVATAYQVGKGMTAHVEELARQAEAAERAEPAGEPAPEPEAAEEVLPAAEPAEAELAALEPAADSGPQEAPLEVPLEAAGFAGMPDEDTVTPAPRRMRFHFEETPAA